MLETLVNFMDSSQVYHEWVKLSFFSKHSLIIHEQNTKEIITVAVVLYLTNHMWIITKLLLRFSQRMQHLY